MDNKSLAKKVGNAFKDNTTSIKNTITTLIVFLLEAVVSNRKLFECPVKDYTAYGLMFIFVPGLILFLISLVLNDSFRQIVQGCCRTPDPTKPIIRKWCPCSCPRWGCSKELFQVFFYSAMASCLWIFWALLQKKYYTCAVMGSRAKINRTTGIEKTDLEEKFEKAEKTSQILGFTILAVILGVPVLFMTARRCCYLRPISSIPSLREYEKLEAKSAEHTLKEMIVSYAKEQGKGKAERYFHAKMNKEKTPSDIIREAYDDLSSIEGYSKAIGSLDDYKKHEAKAVVEEFKKKAAELAKERVVLTFQDKSWREYEDGDPYSLLEGACESISYEYPRVTGDRSKPYKKYQKLGKTDDLELEELNENV